MLKPLAYYFSPACLIILIVGCGDGSTNSTASKNETIADRSDPLENNSNEGKKNATNFPPSKVKNDTDANDSKEEKITFSPKHGLPSDFPITKSMELVRGVSPVTFKYRISVDEMFEELGNELKAKGWKLIHVKNSKLRFSYFYKGAIDIGLDDVNGTLSNETRKKVRMYRVYSILAGEAPLPPTFDPKDTSNEIKIEHVSMSKR